ncbi:hypothetical protein P691DRAFT_759387 [Macrolepiota fuliginosa MF-IS2]|uniref:Uncharacterized protein n=1 Tax=Macrolepiota fuliginosa MF-IS2 TaxID=1400762 RepID=A0A9P6C2L4_9AGAR|nr:hypothetical protein P691DRAFT_759387 [Macrolepiota fuliginosa MF-IS2]
MVFFAKATLLSLSFLTLGALPIARSFVCAQAASIPRELPNDGPNTFPGLMASTMDSANLGKGGSAGGTKRTPSVEIRQLDKLTFVPALLTDIGVVAPPPPSDDYGLRKTYINLKIQLSVSTEFNQHQSSPSKATLYTHIIIIMKFTLLVSVLALFLGSAVQAAPAPVPAPQLGNALSGALGGLTSALPLVGGGTASGGGTGGESAADIQDEETR